MPIIPVQRHLQKELEVHGPVMTRAPLNHIDHLQSKIYADPLQQMVVQKVSSGYLILDRLIKDHPQSQVKGEAEPRILKD